MICFQLFISQTEWNEPHDYNDPANTSEQLKNWFLEMIETFPAMNGPFASDDIDDPKLTDYSIGRDVIYPACGWSHAELAFKVMKELAAKHKVGFFDVSGTGDILIPDEEGHLLPLGQKGNKQKPWWKFW